MDETTVATDLNRRPSLCTGSTTTYRMCRPSHLPPWVASPEQFRTTLKSLLGNHYDSSHGFDRSWTFRYPDSDRNDLMVEVTHLLPSGSDSEPSELITPNKPPASGFESTLEKLLAKAQDRGVVLDRSWRFRFPETDLPDLMVEITSLEKRTSSA